MALLEGRPRQVSIITLTSCRLLELRAGDFHRLLAGDPQLRHTILEEVRRRTELEEDAGAGSAGPDRVAAGNGADLAGFRSGAGPACRWSRRLADLDLVPAYARGPASPNRLRAFSRMWLAEWAGAASAAAVRRPQRTPRRPAGRCRGLAGAGARGDPVSALGLPALRPGAAVALGDGPADGRPAAPWRSPERSCLVVTTPRAHRRSVCRLRTAIADVRFQLRQGDELDRAALADFLRRTGYLLDERVDEPGEAALRGGVVDLFPARRDQSCARWK